MSTRVVLRRAAWLSALSATAAATPPATWRAQRQSHPLPLGAAPGLLRAAVFVLAAYLIAMTVVVAWRDRRPLVGRRWRLTPTSVRRLVELGLGATLAATTTVASAAPAAAGSRGVAVLRSLDGDHETPAPPATAPPATATEVAHEQPGPQAATATVQPGDHFWGIAEQALSDAWGRQPTDAELAPYWRRLIEHNRHRLADPTNPDLLFPGQVVALPEAPPRPQPA